MKKKSNGQNTHRAATKVVTAGRDPASYYGFVNPPVYHASTVLYPSAEDFAAHRARYQYGRRGTPTTEALELALQELEGPQCAGVSLLPSGLAAISAALLAVVHSGDHILVTDSAYQPTRNFCEQVLKRLGVTTTYFDPLIGTGIADLFKPNTRLVYLESPGSLTFEMQDTSAIAKAAHDKGAHENGTIVLMDNTWATPLYFRPLDHGVDLAIQAGTKYIGGHSDVMLGTVSANAATVTALKTSVRLNGLCEGPDDVYLGLRGLRTLSVRLDRHFESGVAVGEMARSAAGSVAPAAPCAAEPSAARAVEARFHRRLRAVQHGAQARAAESGLCLSRRARTVRHRRLLGRLRKPRHSVRLQPDPHRDQMGAGRTDGAVSYRA